nr:MAG TPA: hypothetical protein [Caudoviricetes sp.]
MNKPKKSPTPKASSLLNLRTSSRANFTPTWKAVGWRLRRRTSASLTTSSGSYPPIVRNL